MGATTNVKVVVAAQDSASKTLQSINKEFNTLGKSAENLGSDITKVGKLGLAAVVGLGAFGIKAGMTAARTEELGFALNAIGKANGIAQSSIDETVNSLRGMNIAHQKALQVTSLFIQSELDLADATKLATTAKDLAVVAGLDSSEATETLTQAIIMQRPMLLKQFGIVKDLNQIYEDYAGKVNKSAGDLSELDKRQAMLNVIFEAGGKVAGTYDAAMGSVSKRFRSLTGRIIPDFISEIGLAFQPAMIVVIDSITDAIKNMSTWMKDNKDTIADWGVKIGKAAEIMLKGFGAVVKFIIEHKGIILGVFLAMGAAIGAVVVAFVSAHAAVMAVIAGITAFGMMAFSWVENTCKGVKKYLEVFKRAWDENFLGIKTVVETIVNFFNNTLLPKVKSFFYDFLEAANYLKKELPVVLNKVFSGLETFLENSKRKMSGWKDDIVTEVENLKIMMQKKLEPWKTDFKGTFESTFSEITRTMINFNINTWSLWGELINNWITQTVEKLKLLEETIKQWFIQKAIEIGVHLIIWTETFINWLSSLPDLFEEWFEIVKQAIIDWFIEQNNNFWTGLDNIKTTIGDWLSSLPGYVMEGLTNVGKSILQWLKDTWKNFVDWFNQMGKDAPDRLYEGFKTTEPSMRAKIVAIIIGFIALVAITLVTGFIELMRNAVIKGYNSFIKTWNEVQVWIMEKINGFIRKVKGIFENFKPKISIGLDLPDIEGAWNNLKSRARNLGIPGFQTGGVVPGPIGAPVLATVHGGETISPTSRSDGSGGGSVFNVYVGMYAGTETEKRNIARDLYTALVQVAHSQNKNVQQYMGG